MVKQNKLNQSNNFESNITAVLSTENCETCHTEQLSPPHPPQTYTLIVWAKYGNGSYKKVHKKVKIPGRVGGERGGGRSGAGKLGEEVCDHAYPLPRKNWNAILH